MQEYRDIFNNYFKRFDIKEPNLWRKFHHSYRVAKYSKKIGEYLNLNEHDILLCEIIGLFHDIGRFEQYTKYKTYNDNESIDHSVKSIEVIKEENILENIDDSDKDIILLAIKNHNKAKIENINDARTLIFCKIIRDADKLDILFEQINVISKPEKDLSEKLLNNIYNKEPCLNEDVHTDIDKLLRQMAFVFDLNFTYSLKYLKEKNWFKNKYNLLDNYVEAKEKVKELKEFINKYVEEMTLC